MGIVTASAQADEPSVLQELTITEHFGVSHVEQLIDFDLQAKATLGKVHVIGPDGEAVPFQIIDGGSKIAVMASLPAGETRTWKLIAGPPPKRFPDIVEVKRTTAGKLGVYSISNGLTGVKVPVAVRGPSLDYVMPWAQPWEDRGVTEFWLPAPIQDVMMRDRKWANPAINPGLAVKATRFVKSETNVIERGPLRATVEIVYHFQTQPYIFIDKVYRPGGDGVHTSAQFVWRQGGRLC